MLSPILVLILTSFLALVSAQAIDPTTIDPATRTKWCNDQKAACPLLCTQVRGSGGTTQNRCDSTTLAYSCICSNGQVPNASEFSQTIPFYQCQTSQDNCVANCAGQSACQSSCRQDHPCGAQNPTRVTSSSSASTASATSSGSGAGSGSSTSSSRSAATSGSFTGFGGSSTSTSTPNAAEKMQVVALGYGRAYGLVTVLAGILAGFLLFL